MTELELKKYSRNALLGSFVSMLTAGLATMMYLSHIHISEPPRQGMHTYAVFC